MSRLILAILICILSTTAYSDTGIASFYGWRENGRTMANGKPFHALGASAASRTLPLGTHATVTNLGNGRRADVVIEDRGPFSHHRIIDVSLGTARVLGMERQGLARVRVDVAKSVGKKRKRHA